MSCATSAGQVSKDVRSWWLESRREIGTYCLLGALSLAAFCAVLCSALCFSMNMVFLPLLLASIARALLLPRLICQMLRGRAEDENRSVRYSSSRASLWIFGPGSFVNKVVLLELALKVIDWLQVAFYPSVLIAAFILTLYENDAQNLGNLWFVNLALVAQYASLAFREMGTWHYSMENYPSPPPPSGLSAVDQERAPPPAAATTGSPPRVETPPPTYAQALEEDKEGH